MDNGRQGFNALALESATKRSPGLLAVKRRGVGENHGYTEKAQLKEQDRPAPGT